MKSEEARLAVRQVMHEINQPLNVIRLVCGNLRARCENSLDPDLEAYVFEKLFRIETQVERAAELTRNVLGDSVD